MKPTDLGWGDATADHVTTRRHNLSIVLLHLRRAGPRSRARLAEETGLNKATVSSLVAELIGRGLVAQGQTERGAVGRPGQSIELDGRRVWGIGAEVSVGFVAVLAMNLRGEVVFQKRTMLDTAQMSPPMVLASLEALVRETVAAAADAGATPVGVSVAVPGLVESASGTLTVAPNLGWRSVPIVDELTRLLGDPPYPVVLDNEANLAAVAELNDRGSVRADLLLVTGAAGVGGGVVSQGRLLKGGRGFAGEVGHMRVDPQGRQCACGRRGCLETLVGLNALLAGAADPDDWVQDPSQDVERRLSEIARRAEAGDDRTLDAIAQVAAWLGVGTGILVNVLDPDILVFGGYFGSLAPWLSDTVRSELRSQVFAPDIGGCQVVFSALGFTGPLRGGAESVLENVFNDPTMVPSTEDSSAPVA